MAVTRSSDKGGQKNEEGSGKSASKKGTETQPTQQEEMVPLSSVQKLIDESIKKYQTQNPVNGNEELVKLLASALKKDDDYQKFDKRKYRNPEPGDILEEPVVFWSQGFGFVIGDDADQVGRPIPAPLGVIVFEPVSSKRIQRGKEQNMLILCKHICQSKKELEFLRNHRIYNIRIFERATGVETVDTRYATLIAQYAAGLRNTEGYRVIQQARDLGFPIIEDIDALRLQIAQYHAKAEVEKSEEAMKGNIRKEKKEALLVGHKDVK